MASSGACEGPPRSLIMDRGGGGAGELGGCRCRAGVSVDGGEWCRQEREVVCQVWSPPQLGVSQGLVTGEASRKGDVWLAGDRPAGGPGSPSFLALEVARCPRSDISSASDHSSDCCFVIWAKSHSDKGKEAFSRPARAVLRLPERPPLLPCSLPPVGVAFSRGPLVWTTRRPGCVEAV